MKKYKKKKAALKISIGYDHLFLLVVSLTFIVVMFTAVVFKLVAGELLVKKMRINNSFTEFLLINIPQEDFVQASPQSKNNGEEKNPDKWQILYPFPEKSFIKVISEEQGKNTQKSKIETEKERIEKYTTEYLPGYEGFVIINNWFKRTIHWNIESHDEYNGVITLDDGYLSEFKSERDMTDIASAVSDISNYCRLNECNFLYIQEPYKISKVWDSDISGILDFSNQNADSLIEKLKAAEIDVLDLRALINQESLTRQQVFYRTDHHWRAESGFWASNHILNYLKKNYGYNVDTEILNESNFSKKEYKNYFLGSQGKKVTVEATEPDDFTLYYPKFKTNLHCFIPDKSIDETGNITIVYDMSQVEKKDYYGLNPYAAYSYGDQPIMQITNELIKEDKTKILLIHDSFCDCVIPFLSLGIKNVDALDIRHFTGSVQTYIKKEKPDIVIVSYTPSWNNEPIDWSEHKDMFDFR